MSNKITASVQFYFKGEALTPSVELNLDEVMRQYGQIPDLQPILAQAGDIDSYSYEYEMLLGETIQFSHAQGLAVDFHQQQQFDQHGFEQAWHQQKLLQQLQAQLKQKLGIDDINQHPDLIDIIVAAYQLGQNKHIK